MTQIITIKDTRNKLADIINQVAVSGDTFVITKFGQPKAMIGPIPQTKVQKQILKETFGAWAERGDIGDTAKWVLGLRAKMSIRK